MALTLGSQGAQAGLLVEGSGGTPTYDASSEAYEFVSESVRKQATILDTNAIRGTRSHSKEVTRAGVNQVGGSIVMHPSPLSLEKWLPRFMGAAKSGDTFAIDETLPAFGLLIDKVGDVFEYRDCYVNQAIFRGREGELVEMELDIMGATEGASTSWPATPPSLGVADADAPYVFSEGVLMIFSGARTFMDFTLTINNQLARRYGNSQNATSITPEDRIVTLACPVPFTSTEASALYDTAVTGASGSLVFTNGDFSTTFTFGNLQVPAQTPVVGGKSEITLPLEMTARKSGSTAEIDVTNVDA